MDWANLRTVVLFIQQSISFIGTMIIFSGILIALYHYILTMFMVKKEKTGDNINAIRLDLGRTLILGLEFIIAADLIGTTTTPDYYSLGILAIIVAIRTLLSFSLNREIMSLSKEST